MQRDGAADILPSVGGRAKVTSPCAWARAAAIVLAAGIALAAGAAGDTPRASLARARSGAAPDAHLPPSARSAAGSNDNRGADALQPARAWTRTAVWPAGYARDTLLLPQGVATGPGGEWFVADSGHGRVAVVDAGGRVVREVGRPGDGAPELSRPSDVAIDAARDRLYVADRSNKRISVFGLDGTPVARWQTAGPGTAFQPVAVAASATTGEVYALSTQQWSRVERFAADGRWLGGWGESGGASGQFRLAQDVVVHPDGRVLVADMGNSRVQVFSPDGSHLANISGVASVQALAVDAAGRILALHVGTGPFADQVTVFSAIGVPLRSFESSDTAAPFWPGTGLAVDGDRVAIAIGAGSPEEIQGLRQYMPDGTLAAETVADPTTYPGFMAPSALAVAPDGSVLVAETDLRVTKRIASDGRFLQHLPAGAGQELAAGPGGDVYLFDMPPSGRTNLRRLRSDGSFDWMKANDRLGGSGVAAASGRVYATEALSCTVAVYDLRPGNEAPVARLALIEALYAWPFDLAMTPTGHLAAAGGEGRAVTVLDPASGRSVAEMRAEDGGGVERVAVGADGTTFALLFDGSVVAYRSDGSIESRWRIESPAGPEEALPRDLAAAAGGRLYVLDDRTHAILVYDVAGGPATATPETAATPTATARPPCVATGGKTAAPSRVTLGQEVDVQLRFDLDCPSGADTRADVVLVIDRSSSMSGPKLRDAKAAADAFVSGLDLTRHRVGLVAFSDIVSLEHPLTSELPSIRAAISLVEAAGGTDIAGAMARAVQHLVEASRPGAQSVILLLTDGNPSRIGQPYVDSVRWAARARARRMLVYAIGLGDNVDARLLRAVAGSPDNYFFAPAPDQLRPIYERLSRTVGRVTPTDIEIADLVGPDVSLVPGSSRPPAAESVDRAGWLFPALPAGGLTLTLRVRPNRVGIVPTNAQAVARYRADGVTYAYTFPVPEVEVVAPPTSTSTPTATSTATPTATPTATSKPGRIFLPVAMRRACQPHEAALGADIVLVVDTSSSMDGAKLAAAAEAARRFLVLVDPARDRVGLVTFDVEARLEQALTADLAAVHARLGALSTHQGTRLDLGLARAVDELAARARVGSQRVVILLSDGQPTLSTRQQVIDVASAARSAGVTIFTIGLGADADSDLLRRAASSPDDYYYAPSHEDLADIYERIAANLPCR